MEKKVNYAAADKRARLYALAEEVIGVSPVMRGREKITTQEVMRKYPEGVTLIEFDIIPGDGQPYAAFALAEEPGKYMNGGELLTRIAQSFVEDAGGNIDAAREDFYDAGGIRVKLGMTRTKKGNSFTSVELIY